MFYTKIYQCAPSVLRTLLLWLTCQVLVSRHQVLGKYAFGSCLQDIPSVFPEGAKTDRPGLNSPGKAWWAKEIIPGYFVCGRPSDRQIKYAAEAGFQSILSLFTYPSGDPAGSFGGDYLPVTVDEKEIVEKTSGLQFYALLDPMDEWASVEAVEKLTDVIPRLKTPALLHCDRGYTISFVFLCYLANQTRLNPDFQPRIHSKNIYEITASMGLDFLSRIPVEVISEVTGEPEINFRDDKSIPRPNFNPQEWLDYWFAYPIYYNWFSAGQIYRSHLAPLTEFEYKSVVNIRAGRGEVNLLNVKEFDRHTESSTQLDNDSLKKNRINPDRDPSYISDSSKINYERANSFEFGDDVGYNETLERLAFQASELNYYHLPFDGGLSRLSEYMKKNKDQLLAIGREGPVLVHSARGERAAYVAVLTSALQYGLSFEWSLQRLKELGYGISAEAKPEIYNVYREFLPSNERGKSVSWMNNSMAC